jgi:G3E family GTPase
MQSHDGRNPALIPVSLITGFLGSGKTTLLGKLLRSSQMADTAVIINEFGAVGLDHHLIEMVDGETMLMESGCICCTVRDDLARTLSGLRHKCATRVIPPLRRVMIESTGLADPAPILHTLMTDRRLAEFFCLDGVITTVDAVNGAGQLDTQPESAKQVAVADHIVLTKTDLAGPDTVAQLTQRLRRLNPGVHAMTAVRGEIDPGLLFGAGIFDPNTKTPDVQGWLRAEALQECRQYSRHGSDTDHPAMPGGCVEQEHIADGCSSHAVHQPHRHDADIRSYLLTFERALEWDVVSNWLGGLAFFHGDKLLRVKGILNVEGETRPIAVHAVQHLFHAPTTLSAWPDEDRRSRLVFITRNLSRDVIEHALHKTQADMASV